MQKHIIRHIINCLFTKIFNNVRNQDTVLFLAQHEQHKKNNKYIINETDLFAVQDSDRATRGVSSPELLPYLM